MPATSEAPTKAECGGATINFAKLSTQGRATVKAISASFSTSTTKGQRLLVSTGLTGEDVEEINHRILHYNEEEAEANDRPDRTTIGYLMQDAFLCGAHAALIYQKSQQAGSDKA